MCELSTPRGRETEVMGRYREPVRRHEVRQPVVRVPSKRVSVYGGRERDAVAYFSLKPISGCSAQDMDEARWLTARV